MQKLTNLLTLIAFVFSCGGQWYALQGVAWVQMIHEYAQEVSVPEAISMTFSGKYPCSLCKLVAEKKQSETFKINSLEKSKKLFSSSQVESTPLPSTRVVPYADFFYFVLSRSETPPTPPPRFA